MKKRNTLLGLALLVAVLVLGVGYAWDAINLQINGTVEVAPNSENFKVVFSEGALTKGTEGTDVVTTDGTKTAGLDVKSLVAVGDTVVATYTVKNNSGAGINAVLGEVTVTEGTTNAEYFSVTTEWLDATTTLAPTGTRQLKVTVTLDKAPVDDTVEGSFNITFDATAQAA